MKCGRWSCVFLLTSFLAAGASGENLVFNGSLEADGDGDAVPDGWTTAGSSEVEQKLSGDAAPGGGRCAKLVCTRFGKDSPSAHAMVCQLGRVGVTKGRWYRLRLRARGEGIRNGLVNAGLSRTQPWGEAGLSETFFVGPEWEAFEFLFRAAEDVEPARTRLQFWFKSTGTLWLDDVEMSESTDGPQWRPEVPTAGVGNFIPNSSFECGGANWGSFQLSAGGWARYPFRLEGEVVNGGAVHGGKCLKIALGPGVSPVSFFDYLDAVREPARQMMASNMGWLRVRPGEKLVLSAWFRADAEGAVARLAAVAPGGRTRGGQFPVGTEWRRFEFAFEAHDAFLFAAAGLDLDASKREAAVLWLDALQLERGGRAGAYAPRRPVEAFAATDVPGNIFTDPEEGIAVEVRAFNDGAARCDLPGRIAVTDFHDARVEERAVRLSLAPGTRVSSNIVQLAAGRRGFFRAVWGAETGTNALRCAVIEPWSGAGDAPIGMNHAYPWNWMLRLSRHAGVAWWRDWSAKWESVEPQEGRFDFSVPDPQIQRVLDARCRALMLLPFPSALWSSTYDPAADKDPPDNDYLRRRAPMAWAPRSDGAFGKYAAAAAGHFREKVRAFHVLNEPLYTSYALPMRQGHKMDDYLRLLGVASRAIKGVDPALTVVGGIGAGPDAELTLEFVRRGGLRMVDVFDLHMYHPPLPAEAEEPAFAELERLMREHGGPKPVWITEYGCYADDDPACVPMAVGDAAMNRSKWRSEAAAAEHIVKFAATTFAHGVRKIFLHAGTCGPINGVDTGGVFFEFGGAPRKIFPAVAALSSILGVPTAYEGAVTRGGIEARVFRGCAGAVGIAWSGTPKSVCLSKGIEVRDIMGNRMPGPEVALGPSPVYLIHPGGDTAAVMRAFEGGSPSR